jgi:hypothetical protein
MVYETVTELEPVYLTYLPPWFVGAIEADGHRALNVALPDG